MMKKSHSSNTFYLRLAILCVSVCALPAPAEEIDLSCMEDRVRARGQVDKRYHEFDVILENRCPGKVNWSMCIERLNPWTHQVVETLSPSGQAQVEKKFRINLQMMRQSNEALSEDAYQEFYLNIEYDINTATTAQCVASQCEKKKRAFRTEYSANEKAWKKASKALADRLAAECPSSGWGDDKQEDCEADIKHSSQQQQDEYAQTEQELLQKLASVDPELCQIHTVN